MGRNLQRENIEELGEDALYYIGSQKEHASKRQRLEKIIDGLRDAARIERAALVADVRHATDRLRRFDEIESQEDEVRGEILVIHDDEVKTFDAGMREISDDLTALGIGFTRPEFVGKGDLKAFVERRRRVREAGASKPEAEVV